MFNKITVSNFKAIGSPIELEIKPITLLFGPNSSGKSSIFQSLLYAYEVYKNNNLDPVHTAKGGSAVDLGGFKNIVHNHDLNNSIDYVLNFETHYEEMPDLDEFDDNENLTELFKDVELLDVSVGISICWDKVFNKPIIIKYSLVINNLSFINIDFDNHPSLWGYYYSNINLFHPILPELAKEIGTVLGLNNPSKSRDFIRAFYPTTSSRDVSAYLPQSVFNDSKDEMFGRKTDSILYTELSLFTFISRLIANINDIVKEKLESLIYLGPFRQIPERNFSPENFQTHARWAEGLAAWDVLYSDDKTVSDTNLWLQKLGINYQLEIGKTIELDASDADKLLNSENNTGVVFSNLSELIDFYFDGKDESKEILLTKVFNEIKRIDNPAWKKYLSQAKTKLYLCPANSNIKLQLHDLGIGIAQIIPIIVSVVSSQVKFGRTLLIEQPELHLHPAIQVELADLFVSKLARNGKIGFSLVNPHYAILETHSEHLMLRLLKRIKQTNKTPETKLKLSNNDLSINFIESYNGQLALSKINIDERGRFTDPWPHGFFEERINEVR